MNLEISLLKRKGLTNSEVAKITNNLKFEVKELQSELRKIRTDVNFWKSELKKRQPMKKCTKCKQLIDIWPFNYSVGYTLKGNRVMHTECPEVKK